jgi:hypothetical protein
MKPWLSKAAVQFRKQVDECYPDRSTKSDGWVASLAHLSRASKSDHNPDPKTACVRALDITARLSDDKRIPASLADQIRLYGKANGRISYVIFEGKIASPVLRWRWRKYRGYSPHNHHLHISFNKDQDHNTTPFDIPLLKGNE